MSSLQGDQDITLAMTEIASCKQLLAVAHQDLIQRDLRITALELENQELKELVAKYQAEQRDDKEDDLKNSNGRTRPRTAVAVKGGKAAKSLTRITTGGIKATSGIGGKVSKNVVSRRPATARPRLSGPLRSTATPSMFI